MYTVLVAEEGIGPHCISTLLNTHFPQDFLVRQARSTHAFFLSLSQEPADIILLDMDMPGMRFEDVSRALRQAHAPRILLPLINPDAIGPVHPENAPLIMDYLIKPCSQQELILTMEEALARCGRLHHAPDSLRAGLSRQDIVKIRVHQYITDHYGETISMQDVAQAMNYSDTHFCRLFKQQFRVNFSVYLNEFRVEQAKMMLAQSDLAVKEVSTACGYRDTSYFIRVFRRHTGTTPSDYRIQTLTRTARKSNKS